jgi:hypothetical protein
LSYLILDGDDAEDIRGSGLGLVALELPVGGPGERDDAVVDVGLDRGGDEAVQHERLQYVAAEFGVGATVVVQGPHFELVLDALHSVDALRVLLVVGEWAYEVDEIASVLSLV